MVYLIICFIIVFFSFIEAIEKSKVSTAFYGINICIIMVFFAALRNKVGTDWDAYYDFYFYGTDRVEFGYMFLNNLFSSLGIQYNSFLFFLNLISLSLIYKSLKDYAVFFVVSLLLFYSELYLYFNFSGIRQGIAISILIFSTRYNINRKLFPFLVCVLLAFSFHVTSIIFIFSYFIPFRKFSKKEILGLVAFFGIINSTIFILTSYFNSDFVLKALFYMELHEKAPNLLQLFYIGILKRSILLIMIYLFGKKMLETKNGIYFFNLYLIGLGIYLSTYLISPDMGVRLGSYFLIFEIFLAGNLILSNKSLTIRLIIVSVFAFQALYKISTYMSDEYYLYNTIFN